MQIFKQLSLGSAAVAACFALFSSQNSFAQEAEESHESYGTTAYSLAPDLSVHPEATATFKPSLVVSKASYVTGGTSLRNRKGGGISISGLVGAPAHAFIYWGVITDGAPPTAAKSINVQRLFPTESELVSLTGTAIGKGVSPCWGPSGAIITIFRAEVPLSVATGNGSYEISLHSGAAGVTNGADPWVGTPVLPLWEGASIVLIGSGTGTVSVFDSGYAGISFIPYPSSEYKLTLPVKTPGGKTFFDNIGADGQHGNSYLSEETYSDEETLINGVSIAGPNSNYHDGDWNGSSGYPLPQLWDDTGHNITAAVPKNTTTLTVEIKVAEASSYDCLTTVANVVNEE
jgi:hypothetical protein